MSVASTMESPETATLPVIEFVAPMPGFPDDRKFVLVRLDEVGLLYAMTSIDTTGLRFLVIPPMPFFPNYSPEIDDETVAALGVTAPENLLVLLVVTAGDGAQDATVNLMAPIIVDQENHRAVQVVLNKSGLPVREKLMTIEP